MMEKEAFVFKFHPLLVLRAPLFPIGKMPPLQHLLNDKLFMESIFLASPELYDECLKFAHSPQTSASQKLALTIEKYYKRSSSRCTPFGLFAGCCVIPWKQGDSEICINNKNIQKSVSLDIDVLHDVVMRLSKLDGIKDELKFYPNNTIYCIGDELRYIECTKEGGKRKFQLSQIENTDEINKILNLVEKGSTINDIQSILTVDYTTEETNSFINDLIDAQIIVSELEPQLTGKDYLSQIIDIVGRIANVKIQPYLNILFDIQRLLGQISVPALVDISIYRKVIFLLKTFDIPLKSNIFHVDFYREVANGQLNEKYQSQLEQALLALKKLSQKTGHNPDLEVFCKRFSQRYGTMEMALSIVLDPDAGIGYKDFGTFPQSLLEGININENADSTLLSWGKVEKILHEKILKCRDSSIIEIDDSDLKSLDAKWEDLPKSISINFKVINETLLQIKSVGGSSASNILGRFGNGNEEINQIFHDISKWDAAGNPDFIVASIVHEAEGIAGNLLLCPGATKYEIPYFSNSPLLPENQINISDLMVSVVGKFIFLRSKKINKYVLPILGNAHNFKNSNLPTYQFLCDMQTQGLRRSLTFNWGGLEVIYKKLPRAVYKNCVLSPAKWCFFKEDILYLYNIDSNGIIDAVEKWMKIYNVPKFVVLSEGDNELPLNLGENSSINIWLKAVKNKERFLIKEDLKPTDSPVIDNNNQVYGNEFIATLLNTTIPTKSIEIPINAISKTFQREMPLGSDWLFFKIYCGVKSADKILSNVIKPLTENLLKSGLIDKWFFVRYTDTGFHLRIRFHLRDCSLYPEILNAINKALSNYLANGLLWNIQTETYFRELERYGEHSMEIAENLFFIDSTAFLQIVNTGTDNDDIRWMYCLKSIDTLLTCFGLLFIEKERLMSRLVSSYSIEQGVNKKDTATLDTIYRKRKKQVWWLLKPNENKSPFDTNPLVPEYPKLLLLPLVNEASRLYQGNIQSKPLEGFVKSIIHMMANRVFEDDQRTNELILYYFLKKYYHSQSILLCKQRI